MSSEKRYCGYCGKGFRISNWQDRKVFDEHEARCSENPNPTDLDQSFVLTREELAELAHRLWSYWSMHIAEEEEVSEKRLNRWDDLWVPYSEFTEASKDGDRDLVDRFLDEKPDYSGSSVGD